MEVVEKRVRTKYLGDVRKHSVMVKKREEEEARRKKEEEKRKK